MIDEFIKQLDGNGRKYTVCIKIHGGKAPKAEAPKAEAPKAEAPKAEAPKAEAPKAETATAETAKAETAKAETAKAETAKAETAKAETASKIKKNPIVPPAGLQGLSESSDGVSDKETMLSTIRKMRKDIELAKGGSASFEIDACLAQMGISGTGFKLSEQDTGTLTLIQKELGKLLEKYSKGG